MANVMDKLKSIDVTVNSHTTLYIIVTSCVVLVGTWMLKHSLGRKYRLPPGPRGLPVIGHLHLLGTVPHQTLMQMATKYGKIMHLRMGVHAAVVVSSPDLAREVLKVEDQHLASRPCFEAGKIVAYNNQTVSLTPNNDKLRFMRKIMTTELVSAKRLEESKGIREEELLVTVEDILSDGQYGAGVNFDEKLAFLVLNQTTRFSFRKRYFGTKRTAIAEGAENFQNLMKEITASSLFYVADFFPFLKFLDIGGTETKFRKLAREGDLFYSSLLASHRNEDGSYIYKDPVDRDFVDVLCAYQQENPEEISDDTIKAAIQDVLTASSSTSSTTLSWMLAEIMHHPNFLRKLQNELDTVVGKDRLVQESDINNLEYLRAVIKESFRMHPPIPILIPHQSDFVDVKIGGYDVPAKTRVLVNVYAIGRDPQVWENPLEFNPDRFKGSSIDVRGQHFELLPFGAGRRMCVGYNLAMTTVEMALAQILHTCDLSLPEGMSPEGMNMDEEPGSTVTRKEVLQLRARPRLPASVYENAGIRIQ